MPDLFARYTFLFLCSLFLVFHSCSDQQVSSFTPKPTGIGSPGQLLLVMDYDLWKSEVGDSLLYKLEAPYPLLPAPEPIFDVTRIDADTLLNIKKIKKQWRNILFIGDLSSNSYTSKSIANTLGAEDILKAKENPNFNIASEQDKWAEGQMIQYVFADGRENLIKTILSRYPQIIKGFTEEDLKMVSNTVYSMGTNQEGIEKLRDLGIGLKIPGDFRLSHQSGNDFWFKKDSRDVMSSILVRVADYSKEMPVTKENLIAQRDDMGKLYISSPTPGSFMETDTKSIGIFMDEIALNNNYAIEAKGIWRMKNDFMGGPFASYLVYNEAQQKVVFVDGFVYAPSKSKRKYLQRLELVLSSLRFL